MALRGHTPDHVPVGSLDGIDYLLDTADRIENRFPTQAESWRRRATDFVAQAERNVDPYLSQGGKIVSRAYRSPISERLQGYAVYLPPNYDPQRTYPLMVMLHGGSSNGNLFLGVTLGNNMSWLTYDEHLWDDYSARWAPDWIIVAPDGYGQVLWRWMGEQDVLDVVSDVERNYNVDSDRIVLCGLSNGGVGAHNIGMRHASRFAAVIAMAGAPSWQQYTGGRPREYEQMLMRPLSGMDLLENAWNTDYRYYHGTQDPGPMRPAYIRELDAKVAQTGVPARGTWFEAGHDLLYIVHRHGAIYDQLSTLRRQSRPSDVHLVTGDYRANKQHWLSITRITDYPQLARAHATVEGDTIRIATENAHALAIDLREVPFADGNTAKIYVDDSVAYEGERAALGHVIHLAKTGEGWRTGFPDDGDGLAKRPGLSGPLTDAYYGRMIHVYGTANEDHTAALRRTAERGSHGWPLWLWTVSQRVVADSEVTPEMMRNATLVLYGNTEDNALLARMGNALPIRVDGDALVVGERRYEGNDVGARFIYPNPLSPESYVMVQTGVTPEAVSAGHNLPDFVPDYFVYDRSSTRSRQRLISNQNGALAAGFFDAHWRLTSTPTITATSEEGGDEGPSLALATAPSLDVNGNPHPSSLPVEPAPPTPGRVRAFDVTENDPAGRAARLIAQRATTFFNYRGVIPGGQWRVQDDSRWKVRSEQACLDALAREGVQAERVTNANELVPSPVLVRGAIHGVRFRSVRAVERPLVVACELALRMSDLARIAARHGVTSIDILSAYRDHPRTSFHTFGLALDITAFHTANGVLRVEQDFQITPDQRTCDAPPPTEAKAAALRAIACELAESGRFSSVLTPNYNAGHRNHFHVDARPDDPRIFVR